MENEMTLRPGFTPAAALAELREHPDNPRKISRERLAQLKRNLTADPGMLQARPLIALPDGTVIAGNMRLRAVRELGWSEIPVFVVDLDEQTARLWMLRDNNSFGEWDTATLAEMLESLRGLGADVDLAGFDVAELDALLGAGRRVEGEDDAPPVPAKPRSKPGERYELGRHVLVCGDSRDPAIVAKACDFTTISGRTIQGLVDLVVTDPPYGVDYESPDGDTIRNDDLDEDALQQLLETALGHAAQRAHAGGPIYVFHAESTVVPFRFALNNAGWRYAQTLIWAKNQLVLGRQDYQWQHEPILYGWKEGAAHRWHGDHVETTLIDDGPDLRKLSKRELVDLVLELRQQMPSTVIRERKPHTSELHPTMKPVRLLERLIRNSSRNGGRVYDPFAGAGATLIAADKLGREACLVELDPGYCDVIRDRWEAWNAR